MNGPLERWQHLATLANGVEVGNWSATHSSPSPALVAEVQAGHAALASLVRADLLTPRRPRWYDPYLELWLDSWTSDREAERAEARAKLDELESIAAAGLDTWYNERDKHMSFCTPHGSPRLPSASFARVTMRIEDQP